MTLLATTALEWTWDEHRPLVFLGEWCKRYERASHWRTREHVAVRNHWDDRSKLQRDQAYLQGLHEEVLGCLTRTLGRLHGIDRAGGFWRTLLDPWLARYLGVAFDRWESLRIAFGEYDCTETITRDTRRCTPLQDHLHFTRAVSGDDWNHDFYADILRYEYSTKCVVRKHDRVPPAYDDAPLKNVSGWSQHWKRRLLAQLDGVLGRLSRTNELLFVDSYFPWPALVLLNTRLGQLPSLRIREFEWPNRDVAVPAEHLTPLRSAVVLGREPGNRFESFLHERIADDLPCVLLESFQAVRARATTLRLRPKAVLTANAHWFNDLFKHWVAEQTHEGATFVVIDHGNGIPPRFASMGFEEEISDIKVTWGLPRHPKHVQLPPSKLVRRQRFTVPGDRLVVVGSEFPRYAFDACSTPIAGQSLLCFEQVRRLYYRLDETIRHVFLVKPYPNLGWRLRDRFVECLGPDKVATEPDLVTVMRSARIVVCTYPQTTFSEAMTSGAPAVLLYPKHLWETVPLFNGLLEALGSAGIVFSEPDDAARHINSTWSEPRTWWESAAVRAARKRFEAEAVDMRVDWLNPWLEFSRRLRSGGAQRVARATASSDR